MSRLSIELRGGDPSRIPRRKGGTGALGGDLATARGEGMAAYATWHRQTGLEGTSSMGPTVARGEPGCSTPSNGRLPRGVPSLRPPPLLTNTYPLQLPGSSHGTRRPCPGSRPSGEPTPTRPRTLTGTGDPPPGYRPPRTALDRSLDGRAPSPP